MALLHDPFEDQDEIIGINLGTFVPYMRGVGNVAGAFLGSGSKGQGTPQPGSLGAPVAAASNVDTMKLVQAQLAQAQQARDEQDRQAAARTKTLLIVGGAVIGIGALGTLVYFLTKK